MDIDVNSERKPQPKIERKGMETNQATDQREVLSSGDYFVRDMRFRPVFEFCTPAQAKIYNLCDRIERGGFTLPDRPFVFRRKGGARGNVQSDNGDKG